MRDVKGKEMEQDRKGTIRNEDIDLERTKHNYDLVESDKNLYQRVKERVEYAKKNGSRVQKNSVVMYSNILTVSQKQAEVWGEKRTKNYFETCKEYFSKEFGKENVVSAKVHLDETAPHMHLHFVPFNKETGKLQARVAMNKKKVNQIHDDLPKFLRERGFEVERGQGKTVQNIEDIHEYKKVQKQISEQKQEIDRLEKKKTRIQKGIQGIPLFDTRNLKAETEKVGFLRNREVKTGNFILNSKDVQRLCERLNGVANLQEGLREVDTLRRRMRERETVLTEREAKVTQKEFDVSQKDFDVDRREKELLGKERMIENGTKWLKENQALQEKVMNLEKENGHLKGLLQKVNEMYEGLKVSFASVAKAVGMMKYDKEEYKQPLNERGNRLVDAISKYTSKWLQQMGNQELAKEVDTKIGFSKGIKGEIQELEPKRVISRGYDREM